MSLPTPINWLQQRVAVPTLFPETPTTQALMLFHTDTSFDDDEEMALIIRDCVFEASSENDNIWYEGIIKDSDREKVQEFVTMDDNFREFANAYEELEFGQAPNWGWISDTIMTIYDKLEFTDQSDEKDVKFWMLVQNYEFDDLEGQHYNRKGRCHIVLIETENLENWDPIQRENLEISTPDGVFEFDLPSWIYELGIDDDDEY